MQRVHVSAGCTELMGCHHIGSRAKMGEMGEGRRFEPLNKVSWADSLKPASTRAPPLREGVCIVCAKPRKSKNTQKEGYFGPPKGIFGPFL